MKKLLPHSLAPLLFAGALCVSGCRNAGPATSPDTSATPTAGPGSSPIGTASVDPAPRSRRRNRPAPASASTPGQFDFYLLTLSWSPEYCATHAGAAECAAHPAFVLHGLWPQNTDGTYPQNCSNAPGPSNPGAYSDIYPDQGLLQHEWKTHGTCSGLSADAFFTLARKAFRSVRQPPALTGLKQQTSMPPAQVLSLVEGSNPSLKGSNLALSCGGNYLTAVEVCLDKGLQPASCGTLRTCGATSIKIPPP